MPPLLVQHPVFEDDCSKLVSLSHNWTAESSEELCKLLLSRPHPRPMKSDSGKSEDSLGNSIFQRFPGEQPRLSSPLLALATQIELGQPAAAAAAPGSKSEMQVLRPRPRPAPAAESTSASNKQISQIFMCMELLQRHQALTLSREMLCRLQDHLLVATETLDRALKGASSGQTAENTRAGTL